MRKNLNYFMAIAVALTMGLSSCSKDSDPTPAQDIAKDYTGTELTATNAGETIPGGSVKIEAIDNTTAKITLNSIVNGQPSFEMNAAVVQTKAEYAFTGAKDIDGMKVAVKGVVIDGKATVDVAVEMTGTAILNSWNFSKNFDALIFAINNKNGKLMYYGNEEPEEMSTEDFNGSIVMMGSGMLAGGALSEDFAFTFNKDGYVGIKGKSNFSPEGKQDINIPKLARYYYNPTTKVLLFDAPLGDLLGGGKASPALTGTLQIPFNCTFEEGKMKAVIDPNFIAQFIPMIPTGESLDALLSMLDSVIPAEMQGLLPWIKGMIKTVVVAITDSGNFESLTIGCNLTAVPARV